MLVALAPSPLYHLAGMGFIFLNATIIQPNANVVMYIKVEEGARLATSFCCDKVIESEMVRYYEILFYVKRAIRRYAPQFVEIRCDCVPYLSHPTCTRPVKKDS